MSGKTKVIAEWTINERDLDKLDKLIAYAKKIGLPAPYMDSADEEDEEHPRSGAGW